MLNSHHAVRLYSAAAATAAAAGATISDHDVEASTLTDSHSIREGPFVMSQRAWLPHSVTLCEKDLQLSFN